MTESFTYAGADGLDIHAYIWRPEGEPKAVVQIAHGMAEHARRYERFARVLNGFGYAVYANDHRGHGLSVGGEEVELGHMADEDGWDKAVEDVHLLNRIIAGKYPATPLVLFGHSMGSFMTQQYMAVYGETISAACLSATNGPAGGLGRIARLMASYQRWKHGPRGHSPLFKKMTFDAFNKAFRPNRTDFDWLSRDEAEVDKYIADPLCGFECSIATWSGLFDALGVVASEVALKHMRKDLPLYVFSGDQDPVGEKAKGVKRLLTLYEKHGFTRVTHKFYEGGRHEMLNEINREEVMADFIAWLRGAVG